MEEQYRASVASEIEQMQLGRSGRMQAADSLRLLTLMNTNAEIVMGCKKIADTLVQGVQTLARG